MDSLVLRFTLAMTAAASLPLLIVVLPRLVSGGHEPIVTTLFVAGWSLIIVGAVGVASWALTRSLLAPLLRFIDTVDTPARGAGGVAARTTGRAPLEVRLLRAAMRGREEARSREASERSLYVSTLIHDMKTPLLAVSRSIDLSRAEADQDRRDTWLELAGEEVRRLLTLVQDVVDTERLSSGTLAIDRVVVPVGEVVCKIVDRLSPTRSAVVCRVTGPARFTHPGDAVLLERAIENVVANALHHAESRVSIELMPGLLRVSDDGPGLPNADEAGRASPQAASKQVVSDDGRRSSSLGVFIAKRILTAHGGRLVVESTGTMGTTLLLYLGAGTPTSEPTA